MAEQKRLEEQVHKAATSQSKSSDLRMLRFIFVLFL